MLALDTEWGRCGQVWRMKVINDKLTKGGWKSMKKKQATKIKANESGPTKQLKCTETD